jgi:hypothetical protein
MNRQWFLSGKPLLRLVPMAVLGLVGALPVLHAGDTPSSRAVPTPFVDLKPDRPCTEQARDQRLDAVPDLKAAVHSCMKQRFTAFKQLHPEWFPVEGKPVVNRPK